MATLAEIEAELQKRGVTTSSGSVLEPEGTSYDEFKKFTESLLKGSAKGIVDIVGGYGTLYDYLKKSNDPNAFSGTGISQAIKNLTGIIFNLYKVIEEHMSLVKLALLRLL